MTGKLQSNQAQLRIKQNQEPKIQNYYQKKKKTNPTTLRPSDA